MSRLAKREILIVLMLLAGALMLAESAKAQFTDPESGTWIIGPRIGPVQHAYGPSGQFREYLYMPQPYGYGYNYGYDPTAYDYAQQRIMREQQFGQTLNDMLIREIYGSGY